MAEEEVTGGEAGQEARGETPVVPKNEEEEAYGAGAAGDERKSREKE